MIKILHLYLITSFLLPVILLPSKTTNNVDPECLKCCVSNCGEDTKSSKYIWSHCVSDSIFMVQVIEYTGIYLEPQDLSDKRSLLRLTGLYEGLASLAGVTCMDQEVAIVKNCEKSVKMHVAMGLCIKTKRVKLLTKLSLY